MLKMKIDLAPFEESAFSQRRKDFATSTTTAAAISAGSTASKLKGIRSGWLAIRDVVAVGSTAKLYRCHNTAMLCKIFGLGEGTLEDREPNDWYDDFATEAHVYRDVLASLPSGTVPKFYGAFGSLDEGHGVILLENCASDLRDEELHSLDDHDKQVSHCLFSHHTLADRCYRRKVLALARSLAEGGVLSRDYVTRNLVRDSEGAIRAVDFARVRLTQDQRERDRWLESVAARLGKTEPERS